MQAFDFGWDLQRRIFGPGAASSLGAEVFEAGEREHRFAEDQAKLSSGFVGNGLEIRQGIGDGDLPGETRHGAVGDAAWIDQLEVAQVSCDVESEAVGCDAAGDVDPDGTDLASRRGQTLGRGGRRVEGAAPDSSEARDAARAHAINAAESDERFFHFSNEIDGAESASIFEVAEGAQVEDGIADELARAMVRNIAAAIDRMDGDAALCEQGIGGQDVGARGIAAEGQDGRVLKKKQNVFNEARGAKGDEFLLQAQSFVIGDTSEIEGLNHRLSFIVELQTGMAE